MATEEMVKEGSMPLRKVWVVNETSDSNPQLAEHLLLLSDALHMQLQLVEWEAWIGRYNGDILADDEKSDAAIVIEHRSDETYHYQLGQVLTSAKDYDARILIWIVDKFRKEHRAALDWLNRWTSAEIEVYGVESHTTEAEDSDAKLNFVPVVAPASWSKCHESRHTPAKLLNVRLREFFQPLVDDLRAEGFTCMKNAAAVYAHPFPSGVHGITYYASLESARKAWVYIPGGPHDYKQPIFDKLRADSKSIENELEMDDTTQIDWDVPGSRTIGVWRHGSLDDSEEELEDIRKWMFRYLLKFKEVFNPRMKKIIAEMENSG